MVDLPRLVADFHFLRPWWLLGIAVALAVALLVRRAGNRAGAWEQVIAPALQPLLVENNGGGNAGRNLARWFFAALVVASVGLAGPTWERTPLPVHKQEGALVIVFDLSPSMLAEDLKPNRLVRARLKLIDLLKARTEGTTALVAYSGGAHVVTPLTDDTRTIIALVPSLHPGIMPLAGSNPEQAVQTGIELVMNAGHLEGDLLMITDGVTHQARRNLDRLLAGFDNFSLSILGVGTREGAPIPLSDHQGFARDSSGDIVLARLDPGELETLARSHGGRYATLATGSSDIDYLLSPLANASDTRVRELDREFDTWRDRGYWLAVILLPVTVLAFRRGLLACLIALPLAYAPDSRAGWWQDLWRTPDQQGMEILEQGDPQKAAERFENPQWQGIAEYRSGDYTSAARAFATGDSARAHYNRGNALARAGELEKALAAYDRALDKDPGLGDARYNRRIVRSLLDQQKKQQQSGEGNQDKQDRESGNSRNDDGAGQDGDEPEPRRQQNDNRQPGTNRNDGSGSDERQKQEQGSGQPQDGRDESTGQKPERHEAPQAEQSGKPEQPARGEAKPGPADDDSANDSKGVAGRAAETGPGDEERQAMEQWLRRVPDDPGGLLRRKFRAQQEARQWRDPGAGRYQTPPNDGQEERW